MQGLQKNVQINNLVLWKYTPLKYFLYFSLSSKQFQLPLALWTKILPFI